jgi:hypothetical protein
MTDPVEQAVEEGAPAQTHEDYPKGEAYDANYNPYKAHQKDDDDAASVGDTEDEELHEGKVLPMVS